MLSLALFPLRDSTAMRRERPTAGGGMPLLLLQQAHALQLSVSRCGTREIFERRAQERIEEWLLALVLLDRRGRERRRGVPRPSDSVCSFGL
jgi:hypothetical protein